MFYSLDEQKQLDEAAYKKACSAAYCTRGLHEATMLVHNAQTIIGPDRLVTDELFNDMRERWLKFGETASLTLQQNQADLLNTLIMAFLEPEYQHAAAEDGLLATSLDTEHSFDGPLWSEYKRLCEEAKNTVWNVARPPPHPPPLCRAFGYNNIHTYSSIKGSKQVM